MKTNVGMCSIPEYNKVRLILGIDVKYVDCFSAMYINTINNNN